MALIGKELASDATLDKVLCISSGRQPVETYMEGLAYKGPCCGMVAAESSMNLGQELLPFLFGDTSLKHSGSAFLVEFSFMDLIAFKHRTMRHASFRSLGSSRLLR